MSVRVVGAANADYKVKDGQYAIVTYIHTDSKESGIFERGTATAYLGPGQTILKHLVPGGKELTWTSGVLFENG